MIEEKTMTETKRAFTYHVPKPYSPPQCSLVSCTAQARWEVLPVNTDPYEYFNACGDHFVELLGGEEPSYITPLVGWRAEYIYVIFDGPPNAEAGRFVDTEGSYQAESAHQPLGLHEHGLQWIGPDEAGHWRLRIPVPSGWLVG